MRHTPVYREVVRWWGSIAACQPDPNPVDVVPEEPRWSGDEGALRLRDLAHELGYTVPSASTPSLPGRARPGKAEG